MSSSSKSMPTSCATFAATPSTPPLLRSCANSGCSRTSSNYHTRSSAPSPVSLGTPASRLLTSPTFPPTANSLGGCLDRRLRQLPGKRKTGMKEHRRLSRAGPQGRLACHPLHVRHRHGRAPPDRPWWPDLHVLPFLM